MISHLMIQALIEIIITIVGSSEIKIASKESIPPALDLQPVCAGAWKLKISSLFCPFLRFIDLLIGFVSRKD